MKILSTSYNSNENNFKGVYYSKMACFPSEVRSNNFKQNYFKLFAEKEPSKLLKDIVENTAIFKDLSERTDVFITTLFEKTKDNSNEVGHFHAIFLNPYSVEDTVDEINLITTGFDKDHIFGKFKNFFKNLPTYNILRERNADKPIIIFRHKASNLLGNVFYDI